MTYPAFPAIAQRPGFPVSRKPKTATIRQVAISGRTTFQPLWPGPLWSYEISFEVLNAGSSSRGGLAASEYQTLVGFINGVMASPGGVFTWTDVNDNAVVNQATGTGDGTTTAFQLVRTMGGFAEAVFDPVCGPNTPDTVWDYGSAGSPAVPSGAPSDCGSATVAPTVWFDLGYASTMQVFLGSYAIQPTTPLAPWAFANGSADASGGVIAVAPAPGNGVGLFWTGSFNWLCRFDDDQQSFDEIMHLLVAMKKLSFTTIRL